MTPIVCDFFVLFGSLCVFNVFAWVFAAPWILWFLNFLKGCTHLQETAGNTSLEVRR